MQRLTLAALAACALLGGCATDGATKSEYADASYTPVGTYIPRKEPSRMDNVVIVDKRSLENERDNGSRTINAPGNKNF